MRRVMAILVVAAWGLGSPTTAWAKDMNGRLALGGQRTLSGVSGLDVTYWAGKLELNGTINLFFASPEEGDSDVSVALAVGALFPLLASEDFDLSVGGRFSIQSGDGAQIGLEGPVRIQWFVTDHLLLFGEVGVLLELIPEEGRMSSPAGMGDVSSGQGTGFYIGVTDLTGGGGFAVIF